MDFFGNSKDTFLRPVKAALTSSMLIAVTKFSIQTCERLAMSQITDVDWLSKPDRNTGMDVCVMLGS